MRKFYVTMLFAVLATGVANAQTDHRRLRWSAPSFATQNFDVTSTTTSNAGSFLNSNNWRIVNRATGLPTTTAATPSKNDTLEIFGATIRFAVSVNLSAIDSLVIDLGAPRSGQAYTMRLNNGFALTLKSNAQVNVRSGAVLRSQQDPGIITTGLYIGTVAKLLSSNAADINVSGPKSATSFTGTATTTQNQLGFIAGVLPVVLVDFNAVKYGSSINVSWTTQQEYNTKVFSVERSADGSNWTGIGEVEAAGYSSTPKAYKFSDVAPLAGINYYRVRIIDVDGKQGLTTTRAVRNNGAAKVGVYPNPASGTANILVNAQSGGSFSVSVFNRNGQLVAAKQGLQNTNVVTLDVSNYASGEYIVDVKFQDGTRQTSKMMVVKQ